MRLRSVAVLGGGPGGLYLARLVKLRMPACEVRVVEQSDPADTFGFGVGLATRTQRNLQAADPDTFAGILDRSRAHVMSMVVRDRRVALPADNLIAIGRTTLLRVLREHAERAGVEVRYGERVSAEDLDADLVVAADGVSSATREARAAVFGARVETHDALYLWAGTDVALPSALFAPVTTEHGTFVAHAYPYAADRSTFLVETDAPTWRRAGFDETTERTPTDSDDAAALDYLSEAFAPHLHAHRLIGNRTRWLRFRTVTCDRWHDGRVVLLGDAAHTAHYSIGSGTKLAMEDGIALVAALDASPDLATAQTNYDAARRPAVSHLQETARRSMRWWDSFPTRLDLPVERLWVSYMTRAGKLDLDRFAGSAPDVARTAVAQYADCPLEAVPGRDLSAWVLDRGGPEAGHAPLRVAVDDPWSAAADELVKEVADRSLDHGDGGVELTSADDPGEVMTMFDVAERLGREAGVRTAAVLSARHRDLAAAALVSGRVDAVAFREPA